MLHPSTLAAATPCSIAAIVKAVRQRSTEKPRLSGTGSHPVVRGEGRFRLSCLPRRGLKKLSHAVEVAVHLNRNCWRTVRVLGCKQFCVLPSAGRHYADFVSEFLQYALSIAPITSSQRSAARKTNNEDVSTRVISRSKMNESTISSSRKRWMTTGE
jgi:hypothetical protein